MSQNIVNAIISSVTPALTEKVGAAIGISPELARKGLAAALPAILGLVANRAATPSGANQLFNVLETADQGIEGSVLQHLSGPAHNKLSTSGSDMLNAIAGGNEASTLIETLARFTGTSGTAASAMAGISTQLVTGQLASVCAEQGLNPSSLASLLSSSKGAIQAALPAGLASLLASSGSFGQAFSSVASAVKTAPKSVPQKPAIATGAPRSSPMTNLLVWLIPVIGIAAVAAWYYFSGAPAQEAAPAQPPAASSEPAPAAQQPAVAASEPAPAQQPAAASSEPAAAAAPAPAAAQEAPAPEAAITVVPEESELGKPLVKAFSDAKSALGTVVDETSAKAALPAIQALQKLLDSSATATSVLSAEQKTALVQEVQPAMASFKAMAEKVMNSPGVKDVLKPAVDALLAKAASFPG